MANEEHLNILKQGVAVWNQWRREHPDIKADLKEATLSGVNLNGVNLSYADLRWADLTRADLTQSDLSETNLYKAYLNKADLSKANLKSATLSQARLNRANLSEADLRRADLDNAKLSNAILRQANLSKSNLFRAYLGKADLSKANLSGTDSAKANLRQADLSGANFSGADLRQSDLSEANLSRTNLFFANLNGTDFTFANFEDAALAETIFSDTNLRNAKGLDKCQHDGPSTIDYRTLKKSYPLPLEFLRGCGLSEWQIEAAKLNVGGLTPQQVIDVAYKICDLYIASPIQYFSAFISYSHDDEVFAHKLHDKLQDKGIRCWLDEHQMLPGDDIYEEIDRGICHWDKVLLCCSKNSLASWWVDNEIDTTFEKERLLMKERGKKILALIPLNLDDYMFSEDWESGKKRQLQSRVAANFVGWGKPKDKFDTELAKVIKALRLDDMGREKPPIPHL